MRENILKGVSLGSWKIENRGLVRFYTASDSGIAKMVWASYFAVFS